MPVPAPGAPSCPRRSREDTGSGSRAEQRGPRRDYHHRSDGFSTSRSRQASSCWLQGNRTAHTLPPRRTRRVRPSPVPALVRGAELGDPAAAPARPPCPAPPRPPGTAPACLSGAPQSTSINALEHFESITWVFTEMPELFNPVASLRALLRCCRGNGNASSQLCNALHGDRHYFLIFSNHIQP